MLEARLANVTDFRLKIILARKPYRMIHLTRSAQLDGRLSHSIRFKHQPTVVRDIFEIIDIYISFKWLHTFVGFGGGGCWC